MIRSCAIAGALLLTGLTLGCGSTPLRDATQVLVVVEAEPGVRARAAVLELTVRGLALDAPKPETRVLRASDDQLVLPYTLALTPQNGDESRSYEVLVTARDQGEQFVAQARVQSGYIAQRRLLLPVVLRDDCIDVRSCSSTQTCRGGQCVSATTEPAALEAFTGGEAPRASVSRPIKPDAGEVPSEDAGVDAGEPCPNGQCPCVDGLTRPCDGTDNGECERGTQTCVDKRWQDCVGHRSKSDEVCNGLDDDCNGNVDDRAPCDPAALSHTRKADCIAGACVTTQCEAYWGDCDGDARNGCEQSLTSLAYCGTCDDACEIDHALYSCETGQCRVTECDVDWYDCDADGQSCETAINTSDDCGACGVPCELDNASAQCGGPPGARVCQLYQCDAGFDDCDDQVETGCEADLSSDLLNCGACDNDCASKANADSGTCDDGVCSLVCKTNFIDCDGDTNNGCEVDLRIAPCPACLARTSNIDASQFSYDGSVLVDFSCGITHTFDSTTRTWDYADCCGGPCPEVSPLPVSQNDSSAPQLVVLRAASLNVAAGTTVRLVGQYPVLLAVRGNATIAGTLDVSAAADVPGAGGNSSCSVARTGQTGVSTGQAGVAQVAGTVSSGGGGGGFGTRGGLGGVSVTVPRSGGYELPDVDLSPLYAGCAGGAGHVSPACVPQLPGAGGGALQLAVAGKLTVTGTLMANGGAAPVACPNPTGRSAGSGGGAGGAILLEAVTFDIDALDLRTQVIGGAGSASTTGASGGQGSSSGAVGSPGAFTAPAGGGGGGGYGRAVMRSCMP